MNRNAEMPRRLYAADTIEQLAAYIYDDPEVQKTFIQTVLRYNELCQNGKDTDYGKEPALLHKLVKAPYYAVGQL